MKTKAAKSIPLTVAARISKRLCAMLGTPESSAGSLNGVWHSEVTWRFRHDDGSAWSKLGFGPTRKMVTLNYADNLQSANLTVTA